jgi:hypothetical protein
MLYIYLDTSFLSQLTKVARGLPRVSNIEKWANLLTLLRQGVNRGILLCPPSQFQIEELMLAKGLFQQFVSFQLELSKGCYFKKYQDILVHQVANQVLIYLKRPQHIDLGWKAFTSTSPPVRDAFTTAIARLNMVWYAELARRLREKYSRKLSYNEYYREEKSDFLRQTFLNPNSDWLGILISEAKIQEKDISTLLRFFNSKSVDCVPFISIFCSLWASTIFHEQTRTYKSGDLYDVVALACAIPYCQIITTDSNMKNIIGRLDFNKKYGVSVYTPTIKDLEDFVKVLSGLKSK